MRDSEYPNGINADTSLDIDELFGAPAPSVQTTQIKDEPVSPAKPKRETQEDVKPKLEEDPDFILPSPTKAKPKPGRLISNERPLEDYNRLVQGEGDMFKKAVRPHVVQADNRSKTSPPSSRRMSRRHSRTRRSRSPSSASRLCARRRSRSRRSRRTMSASE